MVTKRIEETTPARFRSVESAVRAALVDLVLDDFGEAKAASAVALARAIDEAEGATNGGIIAAVPSMARELRATLDEIAESVAGDDPLLAKLNGDD